MDEDDQIQGGSRVVVHTLQSRIWFASCHTELFTLHQRGSSLQSHFCKIVCHNLVKIPHSFLQNGLLSMLPHLGMVCLIPSGKLFDYLRTRQVLSLTNLRKLFNSVGFFVPGLCFIFLQLVPSHLKMLHVVIISIGQSFLQLAISGGFQYSHPDLAGPFSGNHGSVNEY